MPALALKTLVNAVAERSREPARRGPVALVSPPPAEAAEPASNDAIDRSLLHELAAIHAVPVELLERQVVLLREIIASIQGQPKSYRNVMDKIGDVQRAALWVLSGAKTQAGFRQFFGPDGFMRPTKSVAWDLFNRVFKRTPSMSVLPR